MDATVIITRSGTAQDGISVKLNGLYRDKDHDKCHIYVGMRSQWVTLNSESSWTMYLFGVRFVNGKLELLFDERPRRYHDPQAWQALECRPADEASSKVLRELFEDKAYEGKGMFVNKVPLAWPW